MMFCPKCGSILMPKQGKLGCPRCSYKTTEKQEAIVREKVESQKAVDVIEKEIETLPLIEAECPKCKHKKAYFWTLQTRAADEAATRFYKCEKCKHIWREYD